MSYDDEPYVTDDPMAELEDTLADCGWDDDAGICRDAGTEHCQFRCPFNEERTP